MAGRISFPLADLAKVVDQFTTEGVTLVPTTDCLFNPEFYPDGKIVDKNGLTEKEADKKGLPWWPDHTKIDSSKLTPKLVVVVSDGVYIMANVKNPHNVDADGKPKDVIVAYGLGWNPKKDPQFWEKKRTIFNGEDGSVTIDLGWYEATRVTAKRNMTIAFGARSVRLVD